MTALDMIVQVANHHHNEGGLITTLELGQASVMHQRRERSIAFELFLCGSILIIGLYHFLLFLLRREDLSLLYFSLCELFNSHGRIYDRVRI